MYGLKHSGLGLLVATPVENLVGLKSRDVRDAWDAAVSARIGAVDVIS